MFGGSTGLLTTGHRGTSSVTGFRAKGFDLTAERKAQLLAAHARVFDGLQEAVAGLDARDWSTPTGCPGWDVHDQLAHVVGVERLMLGDAGDETELPLDLPHVRSDFGRAIEVEVAARRGRPPRALLEEAQATFGRRLLVLEAMHPSVLDEPLDGPGGLRMKGSQMLRTRVFDMVTHEHDIRRALDRPGEDTGPHVDIAVEQVLRAWARMLPARHGDAGVLGVTLRGRGTVRIVFADGQLHRGGEGPDPTATIHLDVSRLLAIGGGRSDAPDPDLTAIEGDRDWATGILRDAAITP